MIRDTAVAVALCTLLLIPAACAAENANDAKDAGPAKLERSRLDRCIDLAAAHLVASQLEAGNFRYEYDFVAKRTPPGDNQVRQAGTMWALAVAARELGTPELRAALDRTLRFLAKHSRGSGDGALWLAYPGDDRGRTGTAALTTLALVDALAVDLGNDRHARLEERLDRQLRFLLSLRLENGQFAGEYSLVDGDARGEPSPYSDGECLLALARAARLESHAELWPRVLESAAAMLDAWVDEAIAKRRDDAVTKGFYQWGTMAFLEIVEAGRDVDGRFARTAIELGHWMIDVHRVLRRRRNTAYAFEGLVCAAEIAGRVGDGASRTRFAGATRFGLEKLMTWQVGAPHQIDFLRRDASGDPRALGGCAGAPDDPVLRIDTTQHQLHAMILARRRLDSGRDARQTAESR